MNDRVTGARRALRRWFAGGDDSVDVAAPHGWFVLRCGRDAPSVSTVSPKASDKPPRTLVDPPLRRMNAASDSLCDLYSAL